MHILEQALRQRLDELQREANLRLNEYTVAEMFRIMVANPELTCIQKGMGDLTAYTADGALDNFGEYSDDPPEAVLDLVRLLNLYDLDFHVRTGTPMKVIRDTGGTLIQVNFL